MLRLPFIAGTTESDHSLRSRDIGEAMCRITWTPVRIIMAPQTRGERFGGGSRVVKMKKERIW